MTYNMNNTLDMWRAYCDKKMELEDAQDRIAELEAALHRISLGSQNSGTTKESLGKEARAALAAGLHYEEKRLDIKE